MAQNSHKKKYYAAWLKQWRNKHYLGWGEAPGDTTSWYTTLDTIYKKILECPIRVEKQLGAGGSTLAFVKLLPCTCGYNHTLHEHLPHSRVCRLMSRYISNELAGRAGIDTSSRRYIYERLVQEAAGKEYEAWRLGLIQDPGCIYCWNDCASTSPCGFWKCKSMGK